MYWGAHVGPLPAVRWTTGCRVTLTSPGVYLFSAGIRQPQRNDKKMAPRKLKCESSWPDVFPRRPSTTGADGMSRFIAHDAPSGPDSSSIDCLLRRLEELHLVVKDVREMGVVESNFQSFSPDYADPELGVRLYHADAFGLMEAATHVCPGGCVDLVATDPPYFLSNNGITCVAGKMVCVNKGDWDKSRGVAADHAFTKQWLGLCRALLKPDGAIWVSGTLHVIFSVGYAMQELGYRILNDVIWWKTNPAPHLACRYLQHATETILWAKKSEKSKHTFHYDLMKKLNGGRQMQNVWRFPSVPREEKAFGGHPTQKPVALMRRIVECSTNPGDLVLDPFMGSGTTGVACVLTGRQFVGIELDREYFDIAVRRLEATKAMTSHKLFDARVDT